MHALSSAATLPAVRVALIATLLRRYTRESTLVIGLLSEGRSRGEWLPVVGHFVRLLPIRLAFTGETPFDDLVAQAHERILAALEHQDEDIPRFQPSAVINNYTVPAPAVPGDPLNSQLARQLSKSFGSAPIAMSSRDDPLPSARRGQPPPSL